MRAPARLAQGPVDHLRLDELLVGHKDIDIIVGGDDGGADIDLVDEPGHARLQLDEVAHFNRFLDQDDDPRYEVREDRLQAEADADAECTGEDGQRAQVHTHGLQRNRNRDHHQEDVRHLPQQARHGRVQLVGRPQPRLRRGAGHAAHPERDDGNRHAGQDTPGRDRALADRYLEIIQGRNRGPQPAQDIKRGNRPGDNRNRARQEALLHVGREQPDDDPRHQQARHDAQPVPVQVRHHEADNRSPYENNGEQRPHHAGDRPEQPPDRIRLAAFLDEFHQSLVGNARDQPRNHDGQNHHACLPQGRFRQRLIKKRLEPGLQLAPQGPHLLGDRFGVDLHVIRIHRRAS